MPPVCVPHALAAGRGGRGGPDFRTPQKTRRLLAAHFGGSGRGRRDDGDPQCSEGALPQKQRADGIGRSVNRRRREAEEAEHWEWPKRSYLQVLQTHGHAPCAQPIQSERGVGGSAGCNVYGAGPPLGQDAC